MLRSIQTTVTTLVVLFLSGCAMIKTSTTTFQGPNHAERETILVMPLDKTQQDSLEFRAVSNHLLAKLVAKGYRPHDGNGPPQYTAFITYGIDNGRTTTSSVPLYGQTGGGTSYSSGIVSGYGGTATYSGTTTTMPTYGVVGAMPVSSTVYKRQVNVDIWRVGQPPTKVYEIRGVSSGSCGNMSSVLNGILDGMFEKFPGENGKSVTTTVPWDGKC